MSFTLNADFGREVLSIFTPNVRCSAYTCNSQSYNTPVASESTVAYFSERGMSCSYPNGIATPSNCVHKFVTPNALAAARAYFACDSLNGLELENQLTTPCDLQGSHFEQRILSTTVSLRCSALVWRPSLQSNRRDLRKFVHEGCFCCCEHPSQQVQLTCWPRYTLNANNATPD